MSSDVTGATIDDSESVVTGKRNVQQVVNMSSDHNAGGYLSIDGYNNLNLKFETQLGRLVDKLDRIVERLNDIDGRLKLIEASTHRDASPPLNWNIIILGAVLAMVLGGILYLAMLRG